MKRAFCILSLLIFALASFASAQDDVVMKAMRDELSRSMSQLHLENLEKPYFISYRVDENTITTVSATLGELTGSNSNRSRALSVQVRVGDYSLDNTNFLSPSSFRRSAGPVSLPLDDDYDQIRREIWLATDAQYKSATAAFSSKRSVLQRRQGASELPDFIKGTPGVFTSPRTVLAPDTATLEKLARSLSAVFEGLPEIVTSGVNIAVNSSYVRFLNSEGTSFTRSNPVLVVSVGAQTLASDGTPLEDSFQVYASSADALAGDTLLKRTREMVARLKALRTAPVIERYNGPALFDDDAAGEVFSQAFAPAVVAGRFPVSDEPQFEGQMQQVLDQFGASLADRIGGRVMPESFDVTDNPKIDSFDGKPLLGFAQVDDEGTPTHETKIVEAGTLQALLSTRTPTPQTSASTGSAGPGGASPSNLLVTSKNGKTSEELRQQLLRIAKQRGYDYGIIIRSGGSTGLSSITRMAARMMSPNSAGGSLAVYKLFADGHEELARADVSPITLAAFKDVLAAGNKPVVYNGPFIQLIGSMLSGGRAGTTITSFVVPPLLFEEVTLKRPTGPTPKPPLVASPLAPSASTAAGKQAGSQ
jgi:predicted Zn-dependent protease